MKIAILVAFSLIARAQLVLTTCDSPQTTVQSTYSFGTIAAGTAQDAHFCAQNRGNAAVTISTIAVSGAGFAIAAVNGSLPYIVAPSNLLQFTVSFSVQSSAQAPPGTYSASLLLSAQPGNSIDVILLANLIAGPAVTIFPPCLPVAPNGIDLGTVQNGSSHGCIVQVSNQGPQPLTITSVAANGAFQTTQTPASPQTIAPGQAIDFSLLTNPACGSRALSGTLVITVAGIVFSYPITAAGADPPLSGASFSVDGNSFASAQQHALSVTLKSPAVCAAQGYVNLAFAPLKNLPVTDDASIVFLTGSARTLPFSVNAGSTGVVINGQASALFQTGTTAGTITFTLSGTPFSVPPEIPMTIPAAAIAVDSATASNQRTGELDVEIVGFDNTFSAGPMSFTFLDTKGNAIGSTINADFTSSFSSYFAAQKSGSPFLVRISFPVQGNAAQVASVQVRLMNAAGSAQTGTLAFQ